MEKDFLQSLKLEISKNFRLSPYERIAFQKILGILQSRNGMNILLRDLRHNNVLVRRNAISIVKDFNFPEVTENLIKLLNSDLSDGEINNIFTHTIKFGSAAQSADLIEYIKKYIDKTDYNKRISRAVFVLGVIGQDADNARQYIKEISSKRDVFEKVRCSAIESLYFETHIEYYEDLLKDENDNISCSVYRVLANTVDKRIKELEEKHADEIYSVVPSHEDGFLLDVRVLLSKMTARFDGYSNETRSAFILAMIATSHREFLIYTMKAMTSDDPDLTDRVLFVILANFKKLRSPDKLFRSLISIPSLTKRDNGIIVDIFVRFFSSLRDRRAEVLIKDKIYNYIVVMLDTFFESYRKKFMIPEIMEKGYPKEFQLIRRLILRRFNPDLKQKILTFFNSEQDRQLKNLLYEISEKVPFISDDDLEALENLINILWEKDHKIRENSATRIHDIDFEKRYLRNKIVRLCQIIGQLRISEASSNLVKIFNYVKKYPDDNISNAVTYTLSLLNYPYMLGELEVLLVSGDESLKLRVIKLLSLFTDQRSLNILLDYIRDNIGEKSRFVVEVLRIIIKRDVKANVAANEAAKQVLLNNTDPEIRGLAIILIGRCGNESDFQYLHDLFLGLKEAVEKEATVKAISILVQLSRDYSQIKIVKHLKEYLKDSGIKVRMLASAALLQLGDKEVLRSIREMMIIKNKNVQREVLMIIGNYMSVELAYFLISLLKEEYAISQDIIPLLGLLEKDELTEIDSFIVNMFKKYEGANYDFSYGMRTELKKTEKEMVKYFSEKEVAVLAVDMVNLEKLYDKASVFELSIDFKRYYKKLLDEIMENNGEISCATRGQILAYFSSSQPLGKVALKFLKITEQYNFTLVPADQIHLNIVLNQQKYDVVNSELVLANDIYLKNKIQAPLHDRIIVEGNLSDILSRFFQLVSFPESIFYRQGSEIEFKELENPLNFLILAEDLLTKFEEEEKRRKEIEKQIQEGVKNLVIEKRSPTATAYAKAMDEIGKILKKELGNVQKYVSNRSIDRELIKNVEDMLIGINRRYIHETSKIIIE